MSVVMVTGGRIAEPWKTTQPLAFREHVGCDASLAARESLDQQFALDLRDPRPVLHVAVEIGRIDPLVFRRQPGYRSLEISDAGQVLVHARLVVLRQLLFQG